MISLRLISRSAPSMGHGKVTIHRSRMTLVISILSVLFSSALASDEPPDEPVIVSEEKRLILQLLTNYPTRWGRPVNNMTEKVEVYFGMSLVQILDLDEKNQVLQTNIWTRYQWKDTHLKWNPEDFGGINVVCVPVDGIWTPDIVLYNYADKRLEEKRKVLASINFDGMIFWRPPSIMISTCSIDIAHFPYDEQECNMKFGSWTYDGNKVDLKFYKNFTGVDLEDYIHSNEWDIIEAPAIRNERRYSCCPEPYPDLTFYIRLRRRGGFFNYILVLPCVLLSLLTMLLFWLPPESPAKVILGMTIFSAFFILLLLLKDLVPQEAENVPRIGAYYCINMIMIATSVFLCTIIINIYFRGDKKGRVPPLVKKIFLVHLARLYCMIHQDRPKQSLESGCTSSPIPSRRVEKAEKFALLRERFARRRNNPSLEMKNNAAAAPSSMIESHQMTLVRSVQNDVKEIRDYLRHTRKRMETTDMKNEIANEWRMVALILDRTFFFCYIGAMCTSLAFMFPRPAVNAIW